VIRDGTPNNLLGKCMTAALLMVWAVAVHSLPNALSV